jgi:hypothetical protein
MKCERSYNTTLTWSLIALDVLVIMSFADITIPVHSPAMRPYEQLLI